MEDPVFCRVCNKRFVGETSRLEAEACAANHDRIFIQIWDYELPQVVSFFNTLNPALLPEEFAAQIRKLHRRALRGK